MQKQILYQFNSENGFNLKYILHYNTKKSFVFITRSVSIQMSTLKYL